MASPDDHIDEIDKIIIDALQNDGRLAYSRLAKVVGLSEAATRQRVNRLQEREIIQIVAVTDPTRLGYRSQALIGIKVSGDPRPIADTIAALDTADYVVITAGQYDIIAEVVCRDADALLDVVGQQIRSIPGVTTTETLPYLQLIKQTYNWGTL